MFTFACCNIAVYIKLEVDSLTSCASPGGSPDVVGTGEIKYPGRIKTSTAARQFDVDLSRARGRKP